MSNPIKITIERDVTSEQEAFIVSDTGSEYDAESYSSLADAEADADNRKDHYEAECFLPAHIINEAR